MGFGASAGVLTAGFGCSPNPGIPDRPPRVAPAQLRGGGVVTVHADWDDIDAAIARAAPRGAVAVLSNDYEDAVERVVTLLAADGQEAVLRFTSGGRADPRPITIEASFGRPNDAGRAASLASLVAEQLESLAGRSVAPL
ncbi:MAG: hypothetical protein AAF937_01630 [Planctomycetota bacterium]